MVMTVTHTIGSSGNTGDGVNGDFSTLQSWEDAKPVNLTTAEKYTCATFSGAFTVGETVTGGTSLKTGKVLQTDGSTYMVIGDKSGAFTNGETLTGGTSAKTCVITTPATDTSGIIWRGLAQNQEFTGAGTLLTIAGSTTSATQYTEITTNTGCSFRDNASVQTNALRYNASNGAAIKRTGANGAAVDVQENNARISKLQIANTATTDGRPFNSTAGSGQDFDGLILEGFGTNSTNHTLRIGNTKTLRNSLCVDRGTNGNRGFGIQSGAAAYNCTFVSPSDKTSTASALWGGGTDTIQNCAIFGFNAVTDGLGTYTFTTCYTDIASPPTGCTQTTYNTTLFQNITDATRDFRTLSGSALNDNGTTDSTNAATDIAGTSRPSGSAYDVGAWEFVSAGGGVTGTIAVTAGNATMSASGAETFTGTIGVTAGAATMSASGTETFTGTIAVTAAPATMAATGAMQPSGTIAVTAGPAVMAASGTMTQNATGTMAVTAGAAVMAAAGTAGSDVIGRRRRTRTFQRPIEVPEISPLGIPPQTVERRSLAEELPDSADYRELAQIGTAIEAVRAELERVASLRQEFTAKAERAKIAAAERRIAAIHAERQRRLRIEQDDEDVLRLLSNFLDAA